MKLGSAFASSTEDIMGRLLLDEVKKKECDFDKVLRLLREGAPLNARDGLMGWSALDWTAARGHHPKIAEAMLQSDWAGGRVLKPADHARAHKLALLNGNRATATMIGVFTSYMKQAGLHMTMAHHAARIQAPLPAWN